MHNVFLINLLYRVNIIIILLSKKTERSWTNFLFAKSCFERETEGSARVCVLFLSFAVKRDKKRLYSLKQVGFGRFLLIRKSCHVSVVFSSCLFRFC